MSDDCCQLKGKIILYILEYFFFFLNYTPKSIENNG